MSTLKQYQLEALNKRRYTRSVDTRKRELVREFVFFMLLVLYLCITIFGMSHLREELYRARDSTFASDFDRPVV